MWNVGEIHHLVKDGATDEHKITVFLRRLKNRERYYARFKIDKRELANNQRYITQSLKTDNLELALEAFGTGLDNFHRSLG